MYTYWGHKSPANSISIRCPRLRPLLRNELFPAGWMRQLHEGIAENLPENIHVLSKTLKADLRNSWWETALKMERFLDSESKSADPAREIIGFLVMCQWCSIFRAVSRLEFLRSAAAFLKGHGCSPRGFRLSLHGAGASNRQEKTRF